MPKLLLVVVLLKKQEAAAADQLDEAMAPLLALCGGVQGNELAALQDPEGQAPNSQM